MPNLDRYYLFVWGISGEKGLQYNKTKLLQTKYDRIRRGMANDGASKTSPNKYRSILIAVLRVSLSSGQPKIFAR